VRISIVIPSFNHAHFLEKTLGSIWNQRNVDRSDIEVIVIDGGSHDGTLDILKLHESRLACVVSEPDNGQTDALIKGFSHATGAVLCWLCSDDLYEENTVSEVLELFKSNVALQWAYGDSTWIDEYDRVLWPKKEIPFNWFIWKYCHNYIPQPSCFWRRSLYEQVGGLDPAFTVAMDGDLWARFAVESKPHHMRRVWSRMRFYSGQRNCTSRELSNAQDRLIRERLGVSYANPNIVKARWLTARILRTVWKAGSGCYPLAIPFSTGRRYPFSTGR
jgi:glycosyltransferase involved in cell wall biosynthesis